MKASTDAVAPGIPAMAGPTAHPGRFRRWAAAGFHLVVGALLVQSFLGALVVLGWTQRLVRRSVLHAWWRRRAGTRRDLSFEAFCGEDAATADLAAWPGWIRGTPRAGARGFRGLLGRWIGGLSGNLRLGLLAGIGMFLLVGPGELLWATSWYAGWQNSFNKGYEHAYFGPSVFVLGMAAFSAGMLVLPMAVTRLAVTGRFRTLFQWRRLWRWGARRWAASAALALAIAAASSLALLVKTIPGFFPQMAEARVLRLEKAGEPVPQRLMEAVSPTREQALQRLRWHHGFWALVLFPLFLGVRLLAARHYAHTVLDGVRRGSIGEDELEEPEWQALRRLDLLSPGAEVEFPRWKRVASWVGSRSGRFVSRSFAVAVWMSLASLILVSEFLRYTGGGGSAPGRGWWNQPMIQVPWMNWTPSHLLEPQEPEIPIRLPGASPSAPPR